MKPSDAAINKVLRRFKLLNKSRREVIIACSGGVDSMALLFCASKLKGIQVTCLHVTHDIRPKSETDKDLAVVQALCSRLKIELKQVSCYPLREQQEKGGNLEEIASRFRHLLFEAACQKDSETGGMIIGARCVATAHHADDQLETVLMKLGRGCGLRGLSGIAPYYHEKGMILIRPMLDIAKNDCHAICVDNGIEWSEDTTNQDITFLRNRLRAEVLPVLKNVFPSIAQNATDAGEICGSALKVVNRGWHEHVWEYALRSGDVTSSSRRRVPIEAVRLAEDIEIYEWLMHETPSIGGDASKINKFMMDNVVEAIREKKTKTFNWVGGVAIRGSVVEVNQDELIVRHRRETDATDKDGHAEVSC